MLDTIIRSRNKRYLCLYNEQENIEEAFMSLKHGKLIQ